MVKVIADKAPFLSLSETEKVLFFVKFDIVKSDEGEFFAMLGTGKVVPN